MSLLVIFIFSVTHKSKQETRTTLKLKMISLSSPQSASVPKQQIPPREQEQIKPLPVQKPTPIVPQPIVQKTLVPAPTVVKTPVVVPQPIIKPSITPVLSAPEPAPTPKITHPPIAPSVNVEKEFLDAHLGEIRSLLVQNLKYPKNAQRLKMQGEVRIGFRLKSDGSVENIEIIQSSGFELLDEDARALIKNTAPQFPKPTKSISLSVPLSYMLR
jgi:protein TonB